MASRRDYDAPLFWAGCLFTAAGRFTVPGHGLSWPGTYEALAHLFVGALLAAWWLTYDRKPLWAAGALTVLETVMFLLRS